MLLFLPIAFFFVPVLFYKVPKHAYLLLILLCITSSFLPFFNSLGILEFSWFRLNEQDFQISINNDALTQQLVFLVNCIGICVIFYSKYYFPKSSFRYWLYISLFLGSMHGLIISNHALLIFIFWELVGLCSFLLIGYYYEKPEAVYGSSKALWLNKIGDIGFLIGILGIFVEYKSWDITIWLAKGTFSSGNSFFLWFLILGALAKSAQGPFMIWLPDAMAGPTPASALIHAATMVAAGIYLLFRFYPILTPDVLIFLSWLGSLTALIGALYALYQFRLKAILAGSTISQLGWMLSALGSSFPLTAIEHLWSHAFFKAGLFLGAGFIIHHQEKNLKNHEDPQDIRYMGDFYAQNPSVYYALCMLFGALMGVPLTSGFLTKETILAALEYSPTGYILWLSIIFTVLYSLKVLFSLKKSSLDTYKKVSMHTAWGLTLPIYVLAFCSLFWVVSFQPFHINKPQFPEVKLYINGISVITLLLSVGIFWKFKNFILGLSSQIVSEFWGLNALYNIWISKGFISKIEALEKQNHIWINHSLNPLFFMGQTLKFLEEKILVGLILKLRDILVTGKIMNIPVSIAHFFQWLDTYIWDFGILSLTHSVLKIGRFNARLYSGQVQVYWIYSLILILVGSILFYWVMSESSPNILVGE